MVIPPIIVALAITDLVPPIQSFILDVTGTFGFVDVITAIALLQMKARKVVPQKSIYDSWLGNSVRVI